MYHSSGTIIICVIVLRCVKIQIQIKTSIKIACWWIVVLGSRDKSLLEIWSVSNDLVCVVNSRGALCSQCQYLSRPNVVYKVWLRLMMRLLFQAITQFGRERAAATRQHGLSYHLSSDSHAKKGKWAGEITIDRCISMQYWGVWHGRSHSESRTLQPSIWSWSTLVEMYERRAPESSPTNQPHWLCKQWSSPIEMIIRNITKYLHWFSSVLRD